jgi:hypothetical protein
MLLFRRRGYAIDWRRVEFLVLPPQSLNFDGGRVDSFLAHAFPSPIAF